MISLFGSFGSGMYYTCSALYFTTMVGLTAGQVGAGLSIAALAGLLGALPAGMLADRWRAGPVYIGLQLLRGLVFTAFCLVSSFPQFAAVCAFAGLTEAALPSLQQAVVGATVPRAERVDTLAKVRAARNAGLGLGALAATAAVGQGSRGAFVMLVAGNAASYFAIAAALAHAGVGTVTVTARAGRAVTWRFVPHGRYVLTSLLSGVLSVQMTLLVVAMPLWFVGHTAMPRMLIGILVAATLALAAVILLTFAGLWQSASAWLLSYDLADPHHRTAYLSAFQLGQSLQAAAAPWIITSVIFRARAGWLLFGAVTVTAGAVVRFAVGRDQARPR